MSSNCLVASWTDHHASNRNEPADTSILDTQAVLKVIGGDLEFLKSLVELFREDCPRLLAEMREALRRGDGGALSQAAHSLKGVVSNFRAHAAYEAAQRVELAARVGDLTSAAVVFTVLEGAVARIDPALTEMLRAAA